MEVNLKKYDSLTYRRGLTSKDWQTVRSKVAHANIEQLLYLKQVIDEELVHRNGQGY